MGRGPQPLVIRVPILRLPTSEGIPLPAYQTEHSAAMDLHAALADTLRVEPSVVVTVPTGIAVAIPQGYEGQIRSRSGLVIRYSVLVANSPATIDPDYRGEILVPLINLGHQAFLVTRGMRIAQLLVLPAPRVQWQPVQGLPPTSRGSGGFGHTGA
jgi:dUTP pyrophosphatase